MRGDAHASDILIPPSWRRALALARVGVALYALVVAAGPLGQGLAAAYLVFAVGLFWISPADRERLEYGALGADALIALLAGDSKDFLLFACCMCLLVAHLVIVTIHSKRLRRVAYALSNRAAEARSEERQIIAGDFHDGPMQLFTGIQLRLDVVHKLMDADPAAAKAELDEFRESMARQSAEIRRFMNQLRNANSIDPDLLSACRALVQAFERDTGLPVHYTAHGEAEGLPERIVHGLVHVVREGLHNVYKHANAPKVRLLVEADADGVHIEIEDAGRGFPFRGAYRLDELEQMGVGPASIKGRIRDLGGELIVESRPGLGSKLLIQVPR